MESKPRAVKITVIVIISVLLLILGAGAFMLNNVLEKINYAPRSQDASYSDIGTVVVEDEEAVSGADTFDASEMEEYGNKIRELQVDGNDLVYQDGVVNVLVMGTDLHSSSKHLGRSDALIILSVNENTKKIVMSSIMRDTYVPIAGTDFNDKITHAHAYGGDTLTVETVESAFGIRIDKFASLNFDSFMNIVDAFGGVDVDVTPAEKKYTNGYIMSINKHYGLPASDGMLQETGENIHLTGKQALGYCRVRYTAGADYKRTERQREVFGQIIEKARNSDYVTLLNMLDIVAENLTTDYKKDELIKLLVKAPEYKKYDIEQIRIPVDDTYIGGIYHGSWVLRIDFEANREALYKAIYG